MRALFLKPKIILTCEHGGTQIPKALSKNFKPKKDLLFSHHSFDYGAKALTENLAKASHVTANVNSMTRLLIDMNRKKNMLAKKHRFLKQHGLSEFDFQLIEKAYDNYRASIEKEIKKCIAKKQPFYIFSVHSFTPVINGKKRLTDIGVLYRKDHPKEKRTALALKAHLQRHPSTKDLHIHFNRPYQGHTDCFLNDLLNKYSKNRMCTGGCFLEFNESLLRKKSKAAQKAMADFLSLL